MVRVAGIKAQVREGIAEAQPRRRDARRAACSDQQDSFGSSRLDQQAIWRDSAAPWWRPASAGRRPRRSRDGAEQLDRGSFPPATSSVLIPLAIDPAHPFPSSASLGFTVALQLARYPRRQADELRASACPARSPLRPCPPARTARPWLITLEAGHRPVHRPPLFPGYPSEGRRRFPHHPQLRFEIGGERAEIWSAVFEIRCQRRRGLR